jgi:Calcineurin-like phosphoesterase
MRLVHITDLHFTPANAFQRALISSLLDDFRKLHDSGYIPDFLIFSGDLVNNPDEPGIYERFETQFLQPAIEALRLSPDEVIFCPGNHDISQTALKEWQDERGKLVEAMAGDQNALDRHLAAPPTRAYVAALSAGFFDLAKRCGNPWENPFVCNYNYPTKQVGFVAINTGYGCGLEGSQFDRGRLAISANQVLNAFQQIPKYHRAVSLMHHTLADLNESSTRVLNPMLSKHSLIHLFGHVHQAFPTIVSTSSSSCFMIQGGALYERSGLYNGYSCVACSVDNSHLVARYRTYYVDREEFDVGTNVAPKGAVFNSPAGTSYWENLVPAPSNDDVCLWLLETSDAVAKELDATITGKSLLATFVEPPITKQQSQDDEAVNTGYRFTIEDILKSRNHTALYCPTEHGATSILSLLAMKFHSDCLTLPRAVVPLLLDARRFRGNYEASMSASLRAALPESDQRQFKLGPLHENGRLVILVDDVDPSNNQHIAYLTSIRQHYPRARLIVAAKLDLLNTDRLRPAIGIDKYDLLRVGTLPRTKVRSLVEKWKLPPAFQSDVVVDEIQSRFEALGIPQTAAFVSIYLSVVEQIEGYNPINSSTVIENFVEAALQKYKPQYIFRSSFDYRNQIDY